MRRRISLMAGWIGVLGLASAVAAHEAPHTDATDASKPPAGPKLETLMTQALEGADGMEVIMSRVTLPPNTALPKHWHPGEEFAYILDGTLTLWREGEDDLVAHAGDVGMVPLKQVHTAITGEEGATVLVFRVHEQGQPERVLIE